MAPTDKQIIAGQRDHIRRLEARLAGMERPAPAAPAADDGPIVREVIGWMLTQVAINNGCITGDCPHVKGSECLEALEAFFREDRQDANVCPHRKAASGEGVRDE